MHIYLIHYRAQPECGSHLRSVLAPRVVAAHSGGPPSMKSALLVVVGLVAHGVVAEEYAANPYATDDNPYAKYEGETFEESEIRKTKERAIMTMENNAMNEWCVVRASARSKRKNELALAGSAARPTTESFTSARRTGNTGRARRPRRWP